MKKVLTVRGGQAHWRTGESQPYEDALRAAGIEPAMVCAEEVCAGAGAVGVGAEAALAETLLDQAAGLLLMGGVDVDPARYAAERRPETDDPDRARDALECALIEKALARDMPVLGICRGLQILNVQHGGSLVQHLDSTARHRRRTPDKGLPAHPVEIVPGTRLAEIAGDTLTWEVNSRHHQAVARLGRGLRVSALDPEDATVEAIERPDKRFCIAVQWHPENQAGTDQRHANLFRAFAAAL